MISEADLEACLANDSPPPLDNIPNQLTQICGQLVPSLESFCFEYLKKGRDKEVIRLLFKGIGAARGLIERDGLEETVNFVERIKQYENNDNLLNQGFI